MGLAERLKRARDLVGLTQQKVGEMCGIDDSTISNFECGHSEPRLGQLEKLARVYHVGLSYFFEEVEPGVQAVMWRNRPEQELEIRAEFLELCRQYRQLEIWTNNVREKDLPACSVSKESLRYADVEELAETTRRMMGVGERPGETLLRVLEEDYHIKIFTMDLGKDGTAACATSTEFGKAILLNKNCCRWRRNHDLAHELFHLLTWEHFRHHEVASEPETQEEKFATCFASNLLLPGEVVRRAIEQVVDEEGAVQFCRLDDIARKFDVSLESLLWRIHFLYGLREEATEENLQKAKVYMETAPARKEETVSELPERYHNLAIKALREGEISLGRFAQFMRMSRTEAQQYLPEGEPVYVEISTSVA